ncbi:DUF551 domain-containing protein [Achromobacter xylosoxidans]|uniref:DUF551 domain-containing protein n=1 Tax=Alcaligenes xylosoxydans xylosoxydans TaxID=85698 RepID=UPI003CF14FA3
MTNSYDVDHGLSQCPPGPLEPVEIAQQDDTLARTGNTARDQEMYAAGIRTGEENAKHNAAIRAGAGWLPIESAPKDGRCVLLWNERYNAAITGQFYGLGGWKLDGEMPPLFHQPTHWMPLPAAPGVSTVEDAGAQKEAVMDAIADALGEAYDCTRVWHAWSYGTMGPDDFALVAADPSRVAEIATAAIAAMRPAPAAGDALDAVRYRFLLEKSTVSMGYASLCAFSAHNRDTDFFSREEGLQALESAIDAAIAAQRKGDA